SETRRPRRRASARAPRSRRSARTGRARARRLVEYPQRVRDLVDYRSEFPILESTTYLVSHSLGAMPRAAGERLAQFPPQWAEAAGGWAGRGIRAWAEGWWETPIRVGDQVGRIIGAPPGFTVMHQNVAVAESVVLSCFRPVDPARNRVVYERTNFPSVRYLYQ